MPTYEMPNLDWHEYQPHFSVCFGELVNSGLVNFEDPENIMYWGDVAFNEDTYDRVCKQFVQRFSSREISIMPPGRWFEKIMYFIKGNLAPKYNRLYSILPEFDLLASEDRYGKRREIESDYPETLLSENADYISAGQDIEYEDITHGDSLDKILEYIEKWREIDTMFLDELENYFCSVITFNINAD